METMNDSFDRDAFDAHPPTCECGVRLGDEGPALTIDQIGYCAGCAVEIRRVDAELERQAA